MSEVPEIDVSGAGIDDQIAGRRNTGHFGQRDRALRPARQGTSSQELAAGLARVGRWARKKWPVGGF
jgi:hypothetical protein